MSRPGHARGGATIGVLTQMEAWEAELILLIGPAHAEQAAILAGEVGSCARKPGPATSHRSPQTRANVVRLH